jgi:ribosomal protein L17
MTPVFLSMENEKDKTLSELRNKAWAATEVSDSDPLKKFARKFGEIWLRRSSGYHLVNGAVPRSGDR